MRFFYLLLLCLLFLINGNLQAQERCGTVAYNEKLKARRQIPRNDLQFENWLQQKINQQRSGRSERKKSGPYQVPVVVHVIHNGEAVGTGINISDAQILSQISVLNKDFKRLNTDAAQTPALFAPVAGSMDIEFVLAKQDPEGLASDGIVRVKGSKSGWTANDNYELKSQSYWPSEDYLNIWVCDLVDELVGYAQLPESALPGLENSSSNAQTDGVVIWYKSVGSVDDGPFVLDPQFNKGRTVTHEVGHFFGLRHIWGDDSGGCGGTDYVSDTPNQGSSNNNCPTHPKESCGVTMMFQNFMDYTNDACMNLFTIEQVTRMNTVIENSPRRESLLTSHGLSSPISVANDLGIRQVITPGETECSTSLLPAIVVRNYGSNTVTSARIEFKVNGSIVETKDFVLSLAHLQSATVTFSGEIVGTGTNTAEFTIINTNGVADGQAVNNNKLLSFYTFGSVSTPFLEKFNTLPAEWVIQNPDNLFTWQITSAPNGTVNNKALFMNFANYEESYGEFDILFSPVIDLSNEQAALLNFDIAHAQSSGSNDRLKVIVLKNCEPLSAGTTVYDKKGSQLATTSSTQQVFVPSGPGQWRKESVNLKDFVGESQIQLAFVGINDWGNNLYLDNISLITGIFEDLALTDVLSPSLVTCNSVITPRIVIQNAGTFPVTKFTVEYTLNGEKQTPFDVTDIELDAPNELEIDLPSDVVFADGTNTLTISITKTNDLADETPDNNKKSITVVINQEADRIPLRENFDDVFQPHWTLASPTGGVNWVAAETNFNQSLYYNSDDNPVIGEQAWLVSPVLDFSGATAASVVYDIAYGIRGGRKDMVRIFASRDCGNTYEAIDTIRLFRQKQTSVPKLETDWQLNGITVLNDYAGDDQVRIAFVVNNANGNDVYLDNIEFFTTDAPDLISIPQQYSIYGYDRESLLQTDLKITFNLSQRQDVPYAIVDMMGRLHGDGVLKDVLNQTWPLEAEEKLKPGVYIVRMKIGGKPVADRILIGR